MALQLKRTAHQGFDVLFDEDPVRFHVEHVGHNSCLVRAIAGSGKETLLRLFLEVPQDVHSVRLTLMRCDVSCEVTKVAWIDVDVDRRVKVLRTELEVT